MLMVANVCVLFKEEPNEDVIHNAKKHALIVPEKYGNVYFDIL